MSGGCLECKYCLRKDFRSARGLSQHQDQSKPCKAKKQAEFTKDSVATMCDIKKVRLAGKNNGLKKEMTTKQQPLA